MIRRRRSTRCLAVITVLVLPVVATSCDDEVTSPSTPAASTAPSRDDVTANSDVGRVPDACELVPSADVATATDLDVDDGVPAGDDRRRVCTFQALDPDVGITVGVEAGGRFDEKADVSRRSLGDPGEVVEGIGDGALFFFSDDDVVAGVGGVLVVAGDLTIDITLQGLDEDAMRTAGVGIAQLAVGSL